MARIFTYSRFVSWMKVLLPLIALGVLSTIFLVARGLDATDNIPFADVDVDELVREQRITAPAYAGMTGDGTAITVEAERATPEPGNPGRALAEQLRAHLAARDGTSFYAEALRGTVDSAAGTFGLEGGIRLTGSDGLDVSAPALQGSLERSELTVSGPVVARAPFGELTAGGMTLRRNDAESAGNDRFRLVFSDGVRMIYRPAPQAGAGTPGQAAPDQPAPDQPARPATDQPAAGGPATDEGERR